MLVVFRFSIITLQSGQYISGPVSSMFAVKTFKTLNGIKFQKIRYLTRLRSDQKW